MSEMQRTPGRGSPPELPRWLKLFIVLFLVLILIVVALHLLGLDFGNHGVSRLSDDLSLLQDVL